mgnify:CR=1 FL=1
MIEELNGKVYIITGGSRGFGLAVARSLVARGARVGLISRNQEGLDEAVAEIGSDHAFGVAGSVDQREDISAAFSAIKDHFGRLDGLINNAGLARPNSVENLVEAEVLMQVQTNFLGTVFCCQAAIPLLRGGENSRIINISSASALHFDEMCHLSIYAATKAGLKALTEVMAQEWAEWNIRVNALAPGSYHSDLTDGAIEAIPGYGEGMVQAALIPRIAETELSLIHI